MSGTKHFGFSYSDDAGVEIDLKIKVPNRPSLPTDTSRPLVDIESLAAHFPTFALGLGETLERIGAAAAATRSEGAMTMEMLRGIASSLSPEQKTKITDAATAVLTSEQKALVMSFIERVLASKAAAPPGPIPYTRNGSNKETH
jgi:hypothetical protein